MINNRKKELCERNVLSFRLTTLSNEEVREEDYGKERERVKNSSSKGSLMGIGV